MDIFVERLKALMEKKGINEKRLSKDTGISLYLIKCFLQGTISPNPDDLVVFKKYFSCTVDYLIGLSDEEDKYWI